MTVYRDDKLFYIAIELRNIKWNGNRTMDKIDGYYSRKSTDIYLI